MQRAFIKKILYNLILSIILIYPQNAFPEITLPTKKSLEPSYIINPEGFPDMGKWMLNEKLEVANWLDMKYEGKHLQEPINIIIIDSISTSEEEAINNLIDACTKAGFPIHAGHSAEYRGYIYNNFFVQIPAGVGKAFSDNHFTTNNNHGRIFGPCSYNNNYYFTAAFSREDFIEKTHKFNSFNIARDKFASKMDEAAGYHTEGKLNLDNNIIDDPKLTTGDHDGQAVILHFKN